MEIDDRFVDLDFTTDPLYVPGLIDGTPDAMFGDYESAEPVLSESEIEAEMEKNAAEKLSAARLVTRVYNQKSEGSCVANACCQAHEIKQALAFGKDRVVHLSAMSLYKRIGRSPSSGAMVSDGIKELATRGALPLESPENASLPHRMPNTGWSNRFPDGWEQTAKLFRAGEWNAVRSVEGLLSALVRHHPVIVGRQGHSICYCDVIRRGGRRVVVYVNSWGDWGSAYADMPTGFGFDSESQFAQSASWAAVLRSIVIRPKV